MGIRPYLLVITALIAFSWATAQDGDPRPKMEGKVKYPESLRGLFQTYMDLREYKRAKSLIDGLGADFAKDPVSGRMYLLIGEYERALECLKDDGHPFQIGYCYERLKDFGNAVDWYEQAWDEDSLLRDHYLLRKGTCRLLDGAYEDAIVDFTRLVEDFPSSPLLPSSYEGMAKAFEGLGKARKANWLRRVVGRRWPWKKLEMDYLTAVALEEQKNPKEARRIYYRLMKRFPDSEFALQALRRLKAQTELATGDLFYSGRVLYYQGCYREATEDLREYLDSHSDQQLAKEAHYFLAKAYFRLADYGRALDHFRTIVNQYRKDPLSLKAQFNVARCHDRMGRDELAISSYEKLAELFPKSHLTDDALYRIARHYERSGEPETALKFYGRVMEQVPGGDYADDALFRRGLTLLHMGRPDSAAEEFTLVLGQKTSLRDAATYWLARSFEAAGDLEDAQEHYGALSSGNPTSYYSIRARERLALFGKNPLSLELSGQEVEQWMGWVQDPPLSPDQICHMARGERLLELGFLQEGSEELKRIRSSDPFCLHRLASLFSRHGSDGEAIRYASRLFWRALTEGETDFPAKLIHIVYPIPYWITIEERSQDYGINPFLLLALIREESLFEPGAVSRAGAVGLTQVIPPTGRQIANSLKDENFEVESLKTPDKSIRYGSFYLSNLLKEFDGRAELALAAYNAGPENVKRWLEGDPDPERDWFIEAIPFWETRGYVKRVLSSFWVYSHLYQNSGE